MKDFLTYLKYRRGALIVLLLCVSIFLGVFSLYTLPLEAVVYAALLCAALLLVMGGLDAALFFRRRRALTLMRQSVGITLDNLPAAANLIEREYQELLHTLFAQRHSLMERTRRERQEAIDYYTLWVHQIKTPIAAMGLVLQEENTQQDRELRFQLFQIERYVEMVLAYLRMGSDSTDYLIRTYDLGDIVRQALRKYAPIFIRKKITLELDPIFVRVLTDEKWLCFCIEQILSNAVKYADVGGCVHIAAQEETLIVEDNGIGIAPQDLPRIWEKGFTGHNGRIDKRASGIGLYLTKQILGKLGHTIEIASQPGLGTKVSIDLHADALMLE